MCELNHTPSSSMTQSALPGRGCGPPSCPGNMLAILPTPCFQSEAEAKYLKSAAVGQTGSFPAGESVQAAECADYLVAGTQPEMIGIRQGDLGAQLAHLIRRERFHRSRGADRDESRRVDDAVGSGQPADSGRGIRGGSNDLESVAGLVGRVAQ